MVFRLLKVISWSVLKSFLFNTPVIVKEVASDNFVVVITLLMFRPELHGAFQVKGRPFFHRHLWNRIQREYSDDCPCQ